MSAGISYMYKASGGCRVMKRCHDCKWLSVDEMSVGFGKKSGRTEERYECTHHPDKEARKNWKETFTACKFFEEPSEKTIYITESETGQLSFF